MSKILLKNGEIGTIDGLMLADVLIEDGKILKVIARVSDEGKAVEADEVIDCRGKVILPGLIDVHVHFREPGASHKEDWKTASSAAVAGGVTTVLDMPNNTPGIVDAASLSAKRELIAGRSFCNYGLYLGFNGSNVEEINASDVPAVKFYACDSTGDMGVVEHEDVEKFFRMCKKLIVVHAEDHDVIEANKALVLAEYEGREIPASVHSKIRPVEAACKAVERVCELALTFGRRVHIAHVSTEKELAIIKKYKLKGAKLTCEVAPHHLMLSEDDYGTLGNFMRVNPPIRSRGDVFAMWKGLKFGEIDLIATDHAPHTIEEKSLDYLHAPSGVPELDTLLPCLLNAVDAEGLTIEEVVRFCCEKPAEIFGLRGKGRIEEGFDADLVVVDMELSREVKRENLFTKCGWSPYEKSVFKGWPVMTFVGGELVFKDGEIVGEAVGQEVQV
ncbi:MAG: dihydroorotase [Patescibacteria group bacterium]